MPNQVLSLNTAVSPYEGDLAQINQRQRLAELLQSQAFQSPDIYSYNGIQAPIPATAGLNKIAQGLLSGYMQRQGLEDRKALGQKAQSDATDWITKLTQGAQAQSEVPGSVSATPADVSDREQGMAMGTGAQPISEGQQLPTAGGQGEGSNVGSPATQAMTPQARMALLLSGVQNPLTSTAAQSMIANQQSLESQKALQEGSFGQQRAMQAGSFEQQKAMQAQQEQFAAEQAAKSQAFQRSMGTPIMVPDATSPTGFKYVRPEEAVGQPAYNSNAMFAPTGMSAPGTPGAALHGDDYLKTLSPAAAETVKGLAEGRIPVSPMMVRTPQGMQMLAAASQYDPTFDASNYQARAAQRKNYQGGGKQFQEAQALNTVAGHLHDFMQTADALGNTQYPLYNSIANSFAKATGDPRIDKFNTVRQAVTNELSKAYRAGQVTEGDVKDWQSNLNAAQSPDQLKGVIGQLNDLLSSKRNALEEGFKQTMGPVQLPSDFSATNERTKALFDDVSKWAHGEQPAQAPARGGAGVSDGATATNPQTGQKIIFKGGQWQPAQ